MAGPPLTPLPSPPHASTGGSSLAGASHALHSQSHSEQDDVILAGEEQGDMDDESSSEDETMDDAGSKGDEMIVEDSLLGPLNERSTTRKSTRGAAASSRLPPSSSMHAEGSGSGAWARSTGGGGGGRSRGMAPTRKGDKGDKNGGGQGQMEGAGGENKVIDLDYLGKLTFDPFLEQEEARLKISS